MLNNLFTYATSELSQDAFICWLMSYACEDAVLTTTEDTELRECAVNMIKQFIKGNNEKLPNSDIFISKPKRQINKVDVLFIVNNQYVVIIEDKTSTDEHSGQLKKYIEAVKKHKDYKKLDQIKVYYKTGLQSDVDKIEKAGYMFFGRERILQSLEGYVTKIKNQIFQDYYRWLKDIDDKEKRFKDFPIAEWEWEQIYGFYDYIKHKCGNTCDGFYTEYGYVSNPSGGFAGMWFFPWNNTPIPYKNYSFVLYLQFEFYIYTDTGSDKLSVLNICIKSEIKNEVNDISPKELKDFLAYYHEDGINTWIYRLKEEYGFRKPKTLRAGKTTTLGIFDVDNIDCNTTITNLQSAIVNYYKYVEHIREECKSSR